MFIFFTLITKFDKIMCVYGGKIMFDVEDKVTTEETEVTVDIPVDEVETVAEGNTAESNATDNAAEVVVEVEKVDEPVAEKEKTAEVVEEVVEVKSAKKSKKSSKKNADAEVVEVTNIPTEVVSVKENKKSKKVTSFLAFSVIVLALVFSIVDWVVSSVTKNPVIYLHLMDWLVILLYAIIAFKALSFLKNKKKWVKILYAICVVATIVCVIVPMAQDYAKIAELIQESQKNKEQAQQLLTMFSLM